MRILFTNNTLDKPAGTELSVFDYARLLKARGHEVAAFSRQQGEVTKRLEGEGVDVVQSLGDVPWKPEVIHGHHEWETSLAALAFPYVPVISFHRGTVPWQEVPCCAPNVVRWVAVDEVCRSSLINEYGVPEDQVQVVLNGVDLERFPLRAPLPDQLAKVLVFSNYAKEGNFLAEIRKACGLEGVECRAVGVGVGEVVSDPTEVLAESDLVFAKGKAALEALVSGCGLVVCDADGMGALVTKKNFVELRNMSFAYGSMTDEISVENVSNRLQGWNSEAGRKVAELARDAASLEGVVDQLEEIYESVADEWQKMDLPRQEKVDAWAASFFGGKTTAYKLGRELQDIWRANRQSEIPGGVKAETVEMHRIMYAFREQQKRMVELENKVKTRDEKIEELKGKLKHGGEKKSWWNLLH